MFNLPLWTHPSDLVLEGVELEKLRWLKVSLGIQNGTGHLNIYLQITGLRQAI